METNCKKETSFENLDEYITNAQYLEFLFEELGVADPDEFDAWEAEQKEVVA